MSTPEPAIEAASQMIHLLRAHPWHGVPLGQDAPAVVMCYVELVPTDAVKYELDKTTGHLKIDRPQKYSNVIPCLYGLLPKTLCAERVAERGAARVGRPLVGDGDPLDICVLTERTIAHGNVLVDGLQLVDRDEADDKIIAVLKGDPAYGDWTDIYQCPPTLLDRLRHYFLTYKEVPGESGGLVEIAEVYGRRVAHDTIQRSREDYRESYGEFEQLLDAALARVSRKDRQPIATADNR